MGDAEIFAVDLTEDYVGAVVLAEGKADLEVLRAHFCPINDSVKLDQALDQVFEKCAGSNDRCLLSLGAEYFRYRLLQVPFSDPKKIRSVIPFEIEDHAAFQSEQMLSDYLLQPSTEGGTEVFAVMVERPVIEELLGLLAEKGFNPEVITVSGLPSVLSACQLRSESPASFIMLQIGWRRANLFTVIDHEVKAIRSILYNPAAAADPWLDKASRTSLTTIPEQAQEALGLMQVEIQHLLVAMQLSQHGDDAVPFVLEGVVGSDKQVKILLCDQLNCKQWEKDPTQYKKVVNQDQISDHFMPGCLDNALALGCCRPKERERINFRKDDLSFGLRGKYSRFLKIGSIILVLISALATVYLAEDFRRKKMERQALTQKIETMYRETVPDSSPGPDPLKQLQVKVKELKELPATGTMQNPGINSVKLLADISARLPASMEVSFERLIYDRKAIRIRGVTDNFNTVDQMKNSLAESPFFADVSIGSANVDQKVNGVRFELKLEL